MKKQKILYIILIALGALEFLYTIGYQGDLMTQTGFLIRVIFSFALIGIGGYKLYSCKCSKDKCCKPDKPENATVWVPGHWRTSRDGDKKNNLSSKK